MVGGIEVIGDASQLPALDPFPAWREAEVEPLE
jgi:hypothetical protein